MYEVSEADECSLHSEHPDDQSNPVQDAKASHRDASASRLHPVFQVQFEARDGARCIRLGRVRGLVGLLQSLKETEDV